MRTHHARAGDAGHTDELAQPSLQLDVGVDEGQPLRRRREGRYSGVAPRREPVVRRGEVGDAVVTHGTHGSGRVVVRGVVDDDEGGETGDLVERLMGKKPELRFEYIQENARFVEELDV